MASIANVLCMHGNDNNVYSNIVTFNDVSGAVLRLQYTFRGVSRASDVARAV